MPECVVCGAEDFDLVDGLYYCIICQTQSQNLRDEEEEDTFGGQGFLPSLAIDSGPKERVKKAIDKGRPWKTSEAFQIILKEQVKALIKLGAPPKLKDVVFQLWKVYLARTGEAFPTNKKYSHWTRQRDKAAQSVEDPVVKNVKYQKTWARNHQDFLTKKSKEKQRNKQEMEATLAGETFYDEDNPLMEEFENELSEPEEDDNVEEEEEDEDEGLSHDESSGEENATGGRKVSSKKRRQMAYYVGKMSLRLTLSFCHLGLLYTNTLLTTADIIRLVSKGDIPYLDAIQLLPSDFKFSAYDIHMLTKVSLPKVWKMNEYTGRLAVFLKATSFPHLPLADILSSFILKLNLPGEMHGQVQHIMQTFPMTFVYPPPTTKRNQSLGFFGQVSIPHYEGIAMAYLVITMKLLFGLDQYRECELSSYARELMRSTEINQYLFVWDEWVSHMKLKAGKTQSHTLPRTLEEALKIQDFKSCQEKAPQTGRKEHHIAQNRQTFSRVNLELKERIAKPISTLLEHLEAKASDRLPSDESRHPVFTQGGDPFDQLLGGESSQQSRLQDTYQPPPGNTHPAASGTHFSGATLRYITEGDGFLFHLGDHGLSDFTVSQCLESADEEEDYPYEEENGKRKRSTDDSPPRKRHKSILNIVQSALRGGRKMTLDKPPDEDSLIVWHSKRVSAACRNYVIYAKDDSQFHDSYDWLLSTCAQLICCPVDKLQYIVRHLEQAMFGDQLERRIHKTFYLKYRVGNSRIRSKTDI